MVQETQFNFAGILLWGIVTKNYSQRVKQLFLVEIKWTERDIEEACKWYLSNSYQDRPKSVFTVSFLHGKTTDGFILAQISIPYGLGTLRANVFSILLLVFSTKMRLKSPGKYCRMYWLRGYIFSNFNFFRSSVDINIL